MIDSLDKEQTELYISIINKQMENLPVQSPVLEEDSDDEMISETGLLDRPEFKWIAHVMSSRHILQVLKAGASNVALLCTYLVGIMSRFPAQRLEIASVVLYQFDKNFLENILNYYLQSSLCVALSGDPILAFSNSSLIGDWYVLVILCEFYSRFLLTVSDEEFHSRELNLYQSYIPLTATLKQVAFHLFWSLPLTLSPPLLSVHYAQTLFSKFLLQIHDRDCRKNFCPGGHWLITSQELNATLPLIPKDYSTAEILSDKVRACISVLKNIPFVVPFEDRVKTFRNFLTNSRDEWKPPSFHAQVKRGQVFEDGYAQLNALGSKLREKIAITFIDSYGMIEAGIDGGGVFKEFLTDCLKQAFEPNLGLFVSTPENLLYPSPLEYASQEEQLRLFEFLGRIIGKALYERVLIDVPFAPFFLSKWLGKKSYLDDLPLLDKELYQGLMFLKSYDGDIEDLSLYFSLDSSDFGETKVVDLIKGGRSIPVTKENRMKYVYLVANYKLNIQISRPCRSFFRGLSDLIYPEWLLMFSENELQVLIGGEKAPIDVEQMASYATYDSVYDKDHPTIQFFWEAVKEFSNEDRALLLKFITSTPRAPLLGFGELQPPICIRFSSQDQSRLPTASTCVNLLKLPAYQTRKLLKE
jgi:ubiquitin-protein ligase E3 C